jgi:alanyl-tRNA synthetase
MNSNQIRSGFLDFFAQRGHRVVPSSPLVPANDPTLLFSNAGMNQFKDVFLGRERREYTRATSSQKCVRAGGKHNDLEQVGRTARHHTFFEMLGNFSFGDYFKKEAIPWAWELITGEFALPVPKLYVTVFREDDEAEAIWANDVGVPRARIFRMDEKDNFWAMGDTGPCGPCSEIHYDLGPAASEAGHVDCRFPCDCGRYVELWNLVFMQFNRDKTGVLTPLPRPSIDTGAGLERLASALEGKLSNFDTDLFRPLIHEAAELAKVEYGLNPQTDVSLRIIADHSRATTFLIGDGVLPSNEGRGYVLRLIMRRALYHGQTLGLTEPFLYKLSGTVVDLMKDPYPELVDTPVHVAKAIKAEEEQYERTTRIGLEKLNELLGSEGSRRAVVLSGADLFKLHDTFGLRPEFVEDIVRSKGGSVDRAGYEAEMQRQRERARASWKGAEKKVAAPVYRGLADQSTTVFEGYAQTASADCRILALIVGGEPVSEVAAGLEAEVILDQTPFYAAAGGQVGDTGRFLAPGTTTEVAQVKDTYRPVAELIAHQVTALEALDVGDLVTAQVDVERRDATRRNHTATHLLHAALRTTLGSHVKQAGSLVAPDRLRFDFSHYAPLAEQDLLDIEGLVNQHVLANEPVITEQMDLESAINSGAMALFGEKYGDRVRVVSIPEGQEGTPAPDASIFSRELCGGTHVQRTGDIGLFKLVSEGSIAAGTRRIEALTGEGVLAALRHANYTLTRLAETLRAKPEEVLEAAERLSESEKKLRKQLEAQQLKQATASAADVLSQARDVKGVRVLASRVEVTDRSAMRQMIDNLRGRLKSGVIVLGSGSDGKVALVAAVSKDLTDRLDAGKIVKVVAPIVGGSGGGRKDLAEAGGKDPGKLDEAIAAVPDVIGQML